MLESNETNIVKGQANLSIAFHSDSQRIEGAIKYGTLTKQRQMRQIAPVDTVF